MFAIQWQVCYNSLVLTYAMVKIERGWFVMIEYPKATDFQKAKFIGTWGVSPIPIYDVPNMHSLNQLVGYVKHINAGNGTVLYRGQCELHEKVSPSIKHDSKKKKVNTARLQLAIESIISEGPLLKYFGLKKAEVKGWEMFQKLVVEAVLQHYGATTFCVDFVDNHWTALWFGLYKWDKENKRYLLRDNTGTGEDDKYIVKSDYMNKKPLPDEPKLETTTLDDSTIAELLEHSKLTTVPFDELVRRNVVKKHMINHKRWESECAEIEQYNSELDQLENSDHLFLFLYVADTNASNIRGVYMGEQTYTVDLRKTLPSNFLRPCSQHGWVVRGKNDDYDFNEGVSCVVRVNIDLAKEMLGLGALLSQDNFFPDETIDQGYNILLERQKDSRLKSKYKKLLPPGMITDFGASK